jgi:hypothetical protein
VGFASIQCFGSHADPYTSYLVTATRDLERAKKPDLLGTKKDKAIRDLGLTFQTTDFPGTHLSAFGKRARASGTEVLEPAVLRFDDFTATDDEEFHGLSAEALDEVTEQAIQVACRMVGECAATAIK